MMPPLRPFFTRSPSAGWVCALLLLGTAVAPGTARSQQLANIILEPLSTWDSGTGPGGAETVSFEPARRRLFITNPARGGIDIVSLTDPAAPARVGFVDLSSFGSEVTSVASFAGRVVATVKNGTEPGKIVFLDRDGRLGRSFDVGVGPDDAQFTPNGRWLVVVNEGEPSPDYSVDPPGSVTIVDLRESVHTVTQGDLRTVTFDGVDLPAGTRVFGPGATSAQDLEPESVAITPDSRRAWVTLQENNAVAEIDIERARVSAVHVLGVKDHSQPGNGFDPSDRDGVAQVGVWPVRGMYQPDDLAVVRLRGRTLLVTANEGDARDYPPYSEAVRVADIRLDPQVFPDAERLQAETALGRLRVSRASGDTDGDGDYDVLYSFGSRSFSVWNTFSLEQEFDSGREMEVVTAQYDHSRFNCDRAATPCFDGRSDDSGPEPEGIAAAEIEGHLYIFVGLERTGGVMVWELEKPKQARFVQWANPSARADGPSAGDDSPEGLTFVSADDSPNGEPLLIVANEMSGTTTTYLIRRIYRNR